MKNELNKAYNPSEHEDRVYQKWEKSGFFNPDNLNVPSNTPTYTIVLPPPNITANLHVGHSSMLAIEDLIIRYKRLKGYRTLWVPGTDHAAIATQMVVEKKIFQETGQTRHDLGREKLLEEIWNFLRNTQANILHQARKMGSSLDWSREAFTLDDIRKKAVASLFKEMYDAGVIYRGERIVNWCPHCHSTLADDEVEYKEQSAKLYTFKYSADFPITISTTRPETKLGDTAVAVNPKDERYKKYIGQEYKVDFCGKNLNIKIIADRKVEMDFGTGALGVTPAHSMVDWQMAQANNLPIIKVIDEDGLIHQGFGNFSGLKVEEARELVVSELKKRNLMISEEDLTNNLSICYRCNTPIEPLPSKQWFVSVDKKLDRFKGLSLKEKSLQVFKDNQIKFIPERFGQRYENWMENLHDWCISRQIWFGHAIPIWYRGEEIYCGTEAPKENGWVQEQDTLDTWFSSGMWTFSTLGWPDNFKDGKKTGDLEKFHPTQVLETGYDILTLWVSRMIMMSLFALGEIPFEKVYLHGLILDAHGKKMCKSKKNGVDPLDAISEYGTDALRLALLMGATPGSDNRYSSEKMEAKRNFINKLWNVSRFILMNVSQESLAFKADKTPILKTAADKWIVGELQSLIKNITERLENFEFSLAAEDLTDFTWNKLADWYLEVAKIEKDKDEILIYLLKNILILWHPFIPFVTETIWESFNEDFLMVSKWPVEKKEFQQNDEFTTLREVIIAIRNARSQNKIEPAKKLSALVFGDEKIEIIKANQELIKNLKTGLVDLEVKTDKEKPQKAIMITCSGLEIYLLGGVDEEKEKERLLKEKENLEKLINSQKNKLDNKDFVSRAPEKIVAAEKEKLSNYQEELEKIKEVILKL